MVVGSLLVTCIIGFIFVGYQENQAASMLVKYCSMLDMFDILIDAGE